MIYQIKYNLGYFLKVYQVVCYYLILCVCCEIFSVQYYRCYFFRILSQIIWLYENVIFFIKLWLNYKFRGCFLIYIFCYVIF